MIYIARPEPPHSILDPQLPFLAIFPRVKISDFKTKDPPPPLPWVWDLHSVGNLAWDKQSPFVVAKSDVSTMGFSWHS